MKETTYTTRSKTASNGAEQSDLDNEALLDKLRGYRAGDLNFEADIQRFAESEAVEANKDES